jgi:cytochrome c-type biogenesis protein CcmE
MSEVAARSRLPGPLWGGGRHLRVWIAAAVVMAAISYLVTTSLQTNAVYYLTVSELQAAEASLQGQPVRVAGNVVPGTIRRDTQSFTVDFEISDATGRIPVTYRGVVPDIFGPSTEVVVEGRYAQATGFTAATLLAKCPSKFESV